MMTFESIKTIRDLVTEAGKAYENRVYLRTLRDNMINDTTVGQSQQECNAIAQWTATLMPNLPQGLGTGMLFTDNIDYPLHIEGDCLWFDPNVQEPDILKWIV